MRTTTEYPVNKGQIAKIHVLLGKMRMNKDDLKAYKKQLVQDYSDGKETSTTKLSWKQANDVIAALERISSSGPVASPVRQAQGDTVAIEVPGAIKKSKGPLDRQRKKIIHYAHLMGWYEGVNNMHGSITDWLAGNIVTPKDKKVDMERVNGWCCNYGKYKKPLNDHEGHELSVLIIQMEKVYEDYLNAV